MIDRAVQKLKMIGYKVYEHTKDLCIAYKPDYSRIVIYKHGNKEFDTDVYKLSKKNYNMKLGTVDKIAIIDIEIPGESILIHIDSFNNIILKAGNEYGSVSVYEDDYVWAARDGDILSLYNKRTKCKYETKCDNLLKFNMARIGGTREGKFIGAGMYIDINRQFKVEYDRIQTTLTNKNEKVLVLQDTQNRLIPKIKYVVLEDEVYEVLSNERAVYPMNRELRAKKILSTSLDAEQDCMEEIEHRIEIQGFEFSEYVGRTPNKQSIFSRRGL